VVLPRWFPDRPGLAYALALVGFGLGTIVSVPVISGLLSVTGGPFRTFGVLGLSYAVLIGVAALFVRNPPEEDIAPGSGDRFLEDREQAHKEGSCDLRGAVRTWQWYAIWIMFFLNTMVGLAIYSNARAMAGSISGASAAFASAFVVIISVADTAGRLVWSIHSDRIDG